MSEADTPVYCSCTRVSRFNAPLRRKAQDLKEVVAEQALELRLLKKSMIADGGDQT